VQYKNILAMIFNELKCRVNTSLGLVGGYIPCIPPVSAPVLVVTMIYATYKHSFFRSYSRIFDYFRERNCVGCTWNIFFRTSCQQQNVLHWKRQSTYIQHLRCKSCYL